MHSDRRDIFYKHRHGRCRDLGLLDSVFFAGVLVKDVLSQSRSESDTIPLQHVEPLQLILFVGVE